MAMSLQRGGSRINIWARYNKNYWSKITQRTYIFSIYFISFSLVSPHRNFIHIKKYTYKFCTTILQPIIENTYQSIILNDIRSNEKKRKKKKERRRR